jgi:hypothetical protein
MYAGHPHVSALHLMLSCLQRLDVSDQEACKGMQSLAPSSHSDAAAASASASRTQDTVTSYAHKGASRRKQPTTRVAPHTWMRMVPSADNSTASSMQRNLSRWHRGRAPTQGKQTRPQVLVDQHSDATYAMPGSPCQQVCCCCGTSMQLPQLASCYCCWCYPHARLLSDRRAASIECQQVGHPAVHATSGVLCQQQKTTQLFHLPRHMPWQQGACCSRAGSCSLLPATKSVQAK